MAEPRFQPGDRVVVRRGSGKVWQIVRDETAAWEQERAYALDDGQRIRYASESALVPVPLRLAVNRDRDPKGETVMTDAQEPPFNPRDIVRVLHPDAQIGELIRCENWAANPALCGVECELLWPPAVAAAGVSWTDWAHIQGWGTVETATIEDGKAQQEARPFCSLACQLDWLQREHPDIVKVVADRAWIRDLESLRGES